MYVNGDKKAMDVALTLSSHRLPSSPFPGCCSSRSNYPRTYLYRKTRLMLAAVHVSHSVVATAPVENLSSSAIHPPGHVGVCGRRQTALDVPRRRNEEPAVLVLYRQVNRVDDSDVDDSDVDDSDDDVYP
ncbi:hypothetical protein LSAT2_024580 [Lamellibrachia satsuma]|nr:hypothetical protein LSAT2_024580 [Lamellibrachia satsuma]